MSRPRKVADLPTLPDWPPLPEERLRIGWPPSSADAPTPDAPAAPSAAQDHQPSGSAPAGKPQRPRWPPQQGANILSRWRRASRRRKLGIAGAIVIAMLLIATCSSLTLHAIGAVGSIASTDSLGASATQQASGQGGASSAGPTATASPVGTATSTAASTATNTATLPLTITFTCASGRIRGTGKICVRTAPSATLSLSVRYCDGSTAKGIHSAGIADASGAYTWSWPIHMTCVGTATATVTATRNGVMKTATQTFNITA